MKAIFTLGDKVIKDEKIENVCLLIKLDDKFKEKDEEYNEKYVINKLRKKSNIFELDEFEIECPCEDLVYLSNTSFTGQGEEGIYPFDETELSILIDSYNEALKVFGEDNVKITVHSNYLYDDCNEDDFSLEEFLKNYTLK